MALAMFLRFCALVYFVVGALHFSLGLGADQLLGAALPIDALNNATLDSQNRFYGTAFGVTGILLWIAAADLRRYRPILNGLMAALFAGGVARLASMFVNGMPSAWIIFLLATELLVPPLVYFWHKNDETS